MKRIIFTLMIGFASLSLANAQTDSLSAALGEQPNKAKAGATKFLLAGKAQMSWTSSQVEGGTASHSFFPDALMLMPLVKLNNKLFLDAQIEVDANSATGGGAGINLNEMIVYYRLCPEASLFFGNFSPKYGLFLGVLDDFTNRYCTDPVGMARGPQTQTGFGIQGGIQAGYSKLNYQLYLANGPQLMVDSTTQGTGNLTGQLNYGNYADNNNNKAIGGSIGFLPFSNSSLQLDLSGQMTAKTGDAGTAFESVASTSWAVSLNYYHTFQPIMVRVQGEYNSTMTDNKKYFPNAFTDSTNTSLIVPDFDNKFSGWYAGATVRASGAESKFLSNLELGGRVGGYTAPKYTDAALAAFGESPWGENAKTQTTICLTYWFTWKTPLNFAYDMINETNRPSAKSYTARLIFFF